MSSKHETCFECFKDVSKSDLIELNKRFICPSCKEKHIKKLESNFDFSLQEKMYHPDSSTKVEPQNQWDSITWGVVINFLFWLVYLICRSISLIHLNLDFFFITSYCVFLFFIFINKKYRTSNTMSALLVIEVAVYFIVERLP